MIKTKKFMYSLFTLLLLILLTAAPIVSASMLKISVEDLTGVHTYSTVSVENYIKGTGSETLTIITEGGTVGDSGVWVEDTPVFTKNETVLVFLKKAGREFSVAGLVQGKYIVENEDVRDISGEKVSLKDFLAPCKRCDAATGCSDSGSTGESGVAWI